MARRRLLLAPALAALAGWLPPRHAQAVAQSQTAAPAGQGLPPLLRGLPLAMVAPPGIDPAGWLVSEKYDGVRALWDGRQLWFRSGLPVAAPRWFTERLPAAPLDGELWAGPGRFEAGVATVRRQQPDDAAWRGLRYMVFDLPDAAGTLAERQPRLQALVQGLGWPALQAVPQQLLPGRAALARRLAEVLAAGGEGLVLRRADSPWALGRSPAMLKLKPHEDAEAVVEAHLPGKGRLAGQVGALQVRDDAGRRFRVGTGLRDADRAAPPPVGSRITFRHQGRTAAGVPRFASLLRERPPGL